MKNNIRLALFSALFIFLAQTVSAEKFIGSVGKKETKSIKNTFQEKAESCSPATGNTDLNLNNVRARINTGGDMWWDLIGTAKYEVPKGSGKTSLFSAALWIGGEDVNGNLKVAALRYRQVGNDYWPGPLTTDGTASVDAATCDEYDRHFVITRAEVDAFIANYNHPNPNYVVPASISQWPAHGDPSKNQSYYLAPFFDRGGDGHYDVDEGDYPYYDLNNDLCPTKPENMGHKPDTTAEGNGILVDQVLKGDKTLWWVFNDKGSVHTESLGAPIGLEIRAQAFAFATNDEINNMTFYSYEIINRSTYRLTNTYFSQWLDTDLGDAKDDYIGCDVKRGLGYCYNGDDVDGTGKPQDYGSQPPAVGADFFQGPYMDADGLDNLSYWKHPSSTYCDASVNGINFENGLVDDERFGMRRFVYHNNGGADYQSDPEIAIDYYNFLKGIWKDGTKMIYGGNAHEGAGAYGPECDFMFPGDTDPCNWGTGGNPPNGPTYWTEVTAGNQPDDRRFMQSAGPFTLEPGAVNYITVGIPWARASQGGAWASVELLRLVDDKCQSLFDNCFKVIDGPDAPEITIQELDRELILYLSDNPASIIKPEDYSEGDPSIISPSVTIKYDSIYRFEGYQIFQCLDATVTAAEIHDPDKARLVGQCDIENYDKTGNPIAQLVNYYNDEKLGGSVPVEEVNGANKGIVHSFRIFTDEFASGDKRLVNHKQYYFLAIAYGYNNYMKYSQEPNSQIPGVSGLSGQKKVYLAGRKQIGLNSTGKPYTAIPHNPSPEANGTNPNSEYGSGPKIKRIEGQGNGGNVLDLTPETVEEILANGKCDNPVYKNSRGPVNIKVIDPLNVKSATYTLAFDSLTKVKIKPVSHSIVNTGGDTATMEVWKWKLIDNNTNDTVWSDKSILVANEQLFLDLGISVEIAQVWRPGPYKVGKIDTDDVWAILSKDNGLLESTKTYSDSSRQWLGGVPDVDGGGFWNWIRSGTLKDGTYPENSDYIDNGAITPAVWYDPSENYEKILNGTWAPYRLCAKKSTDPNTVVSGYGLAWDDAQAMVLNEMKSLSSVDVVFTSDKNKWTRCCVVEMCDNIGVTSSEGGAKKLDLRKGQSVDKSGNPDGSGTGMGWFPGYAINVETGERLNIMFGEDSWLVAENGRDMIWNPTSNYFSPQGDILWGGKHAIYIMGHNADGTNDCPAYDEGQWLYTKLSTISLLQKRNVYKAAMWVGLPMLNASQTLLSNDATIRIRVTKPYKRYWSTAPVPLDPTKNYFPMYQFSTDDIRTEKNVTEVAESALDMISVVPNPYYAYSGYEASQLDNLIKITNLPEKCTVSIYTVNGVLVRQYNKDESKTSLDWDLKNFAGIPISGGVYLIHIKAEGIGEKVVKWFGTLRPVDLNSF